MTSKITVGVIAAAVLGVGLYYLLKSRNNKDDTPPPQQKQKQKHEQIPQQHKENVQLKHSLGIAQLTELSKSINKNHPTEDQVIELFKIIVRESKSRGEDFIHNFRTQRRKLLQKGFKQYIQFIRDGLIKLRNIDNQAKDQILEQLGMSNQQYNNAEMRYQQAFEETQSQILYGHDNYLSLEEVRRVLEFQRQYLENRGQELLIKLNKEVMNWNSEGKQLMHQIMNTFMIDEVHKEFGYEEDLTERSIIKCKHEIMDEILEIRDILTELFIKFSEDRDSNDQEAEQLTKLNTHLMRNLSAEPQFEEVMKAMHLE